MCEQILWYNICWRFLFCVNIWLKSQHHDRIRFTSRPKVRSKKEHPEERRRWAVERRISCIRERKREGASKAVATLSGGSRASNSSPPFSLVCSPYSGLKTAGCPAQLLQLRRRRRRLQSLFVCYYSRLEPVFSASVFLSLYVWGSKQELSHIQRCYVVWLETSNRYSSFYPRNCPAVLKIYLFFFHLYCQTNAS